MEEKFRRTLKSAEILEDYRHYNSSILLKLIAFKLFVFSYLTRKKIRFNSTQEAFFEIYKILRDLGKDQALHTVYTILIMMEFDQFFEINKNEFVYISNTIDQIIEIL